MQTAQIRKNKIDINLILYRLYTYKKVLFKDIATYIFTCVLCNLFLTVTAVPVQLLPDSNLNFIVQNWPLVIRGTRESDSGAYKCHTSSDPPVYVVKYLKVHRELKNRHRYLLLLMSHAKYCRLIENFFKRHFLFNY